MDSRPAPPVNSLTRSPDALRLGFVPLTHAAPLLAAQSLGLFARHGLRVRLSREVGWATIREKILGGELDAAQALAPMPLAMTLGLGCVRSECVTGLVLNLHGDALVLSRRLWRLGDDPRSGLRHARRSGDEPLTFGIIYPHSAQQFLLRRWLEEAGLMPDRDYRLVVVPPQQMVPHLKSGHLDGGCVGEPWGSLAVRTGVGVIAALSAELAPGHPEKVLLTRRTFVDRHPDEHAALVAALLEACAWCADPANHEAVISLLAGPDGLRTSPEVIRPAITGQFDLGENRTGNHPDAVVFHGPGVNAPTAARARWLARSLDRDVPDELLARVYRQDLFPATATAAPPAHEPVSHAPPLACHV